MDERAKLQNQVKYGTAASHALDVTLRGFIEQTRKQQLSTLYDHFRAGDHGSKMITVIAELSVLDKLENHFEHSIKKGASAHKQLETLDEQEARDRNREY